MALNTITLITSYSYDPFSTYIFFVSIQYTWCNWSFKHIHSGTTWKITSQSDFQQKHHVSTVHTCAIIDQSLLLLRFVCSTWAHCEVHFIQLYLIKFVSEVILFVLSFLHLESFCHDITEILLKVTYLYSCPLSYSHFHPTPFFLYNVAKFQRHWHSRILFNSPVKREHPSYSTTFIIAEEVALLKMNYFTTILFPPRETTPLKMPLFHCRKSGLIRGD